MLDVAYRFFLHGQSCIIFVLPEYYSVMFQGMSQPVTVSLFHLLDSNCKYALS